ncbi:MAG: zinc-binding alcohol dehydrogenase [Victivallales bacterium]|nr:zinc-binding alcohol dehydrogenase [Victivallales bacterium]
MKNKIIYFPAKEQADLKETEFEPKLEADQIFLRCECSAISAGTELANYHALPNTSPTGYRGMEYADLSKGFPFYPGYSSVGIIEELGADVKGYKVGQRVIIIEGGHRLYTIRPANKLYPVSDNVSPEDAAFAFISVFPCLGVRKLQIQLGEACMIAGLGILGLFAVQFAKLSGAAPVLACDMSPERRELALKLGADAVFDPSDPDFIQKVLDATDGKGPDAVVEVTGRIEALQQALEYIAWEGRISLLGCTRISDKFIDFYKYVHKRGITLIGSHNHTRPGVESRPGQWTIPDDFRTFMRLVGSKRLQVAPMINRVVRPEDASAIYHELGFSKNPPVGILIDWR